MTTTLWPQNARAVRAYWSGVEQKVDIKKRMYRSYHMVSALARNLSEIWADCSAKDRNSKEASPYGFFGYFGSCFYSQSNNLLVYHHVSPCGIIPFPLSMFSLHHARCVFGGPLCRAGGGVQASDVNHRGTFLTMNESTDIVSVTEIGKP